MEATRDLAGASDDDDDGSDGAFDQDMEALRRACMITGVDNFGLLAAAGEGESNSGGAEEDDDDDEDDDDGDLELVKKIQNRFAIPSDALDSASLLPLRSLPPDWSDDDEADDDDLETLRAIQKRFAAYDNNALKHSPENPLGQNEQAHGSSVEKKSSDDLCIHKVDASEEYTSRNRQLGDNLEERPCSSIECNQTDASKPSTSQPNYSNFPKSAKVFMDAIKKNRSLQKFLRSKLVHIEAKIEENKKLKERVKILKDFQVNCKRRTGRALSQKKDTRVQLISGRKAWPSKDLKVQDKKIPAMYCGPVENSHVENYRMALTKFPLSLDRKKWSEEEKKNLEKGIYQQFQEMLLKNMMDRMSDSGESNEGVNDIDSLLISIKNYNITPENIRAFLPKVNWEQVASTYIVGRSGMECETRWLNFEDPLINPNPWTAKEDKSLLFIVQNKGIGNWIDISVSLGTNRTPFQCLSRYQRSLNVSILKRQWTKEEDAKLRSAVEAFGEHNWQAVASSLEGWTGTQCSNRWKKSLHPAREKVGRWTKDEDKRLTVAQMLFGPRNWKKTAQFVPGRTEVQCRERWVNSLDPSLNWEKWTREEDSKLREAIAEHGYCWTKVAAALPRRTDNMCRRRWKRLLPHEVPMLQAARRMQKAALICNFVDRESERPAIGPNDFCPLPLMTSGENVNDSNEMTGNSRKRRRSKSLCEVKNKRGRKKSEVCTQTDPMAALVISNHGEQGAFDGQEITAHQGSENNTSTKGRKRRSSSPLVKKQVRSVNGEALMGDDGRRKNPPRKQQSKKKQPVEADEATKCLETQTRSVNSTSNNDRTESLAESGTPKLAKKRRASSKGQNSGNVCTKNPKVHQNLTMPSGKSLPAGDPTDTDHHQEGSSCLDTAQPMEIIGEAISTLGVNDKTSSKKKTGVKQSRKRKKDCDPIGVLQEVDLLPSGANDRTVSKKNTGVKKYRKRKKDCDPTGPSEANDPNKAKPSAISGLDQNFGASDEGNSVNNQNCPPSISQKDREPAPVQVDTLSVGNIAPSARQDDGLKCFESRTSVKLSSCSAGKSAFLDSNDVVGRPNSTSTSTVESGHEKRDFLPSSLGQEKENQVNDANDKSSITTSPTRPSNEMATRVENGAASMEVNSDPSPEEDRPKRVRQKPLRFRN